MGGDEGLLVVVAAAHREHAAVAEDVVEDAVAEQLRLGHELDLPPQVDGGEEVVHLAEVVRREDHRAVGGTLLGADRAAAVEEERSG